jgi:hypothetical protein
MQENFLKKKKKEKKASLPLSVSGGGKDEIVVDSKQPSFYPLSKFRSLCRHGFNDRTDRGLMPG